MKYVIIGAGAAGLSAAKTIRGLAPGDDITVLSTDRQVHSRCMLHKLIGGERDAASLCFVSRDFFTGNNIRWKRETTVTKIDTATKVVHYQGGSEPYDKLLIATGAESAIPPVGDLRTASNVYGLRHLTDAEAIRDAAKAADKIAVIGAGLVGMDAAHGLLALGKKVTVLEMAERVLALNLDTHAAAEYQKRFEAAGCTFRLGRQVCSTVQSGGKITGIALDDGSQVDCDMVIVACGVRPATALLEGSGIVCERSIKVDGHLATSAADVYAAGDVAGLSGIWPNAVKQGEVAAYNMCGKPRTYDDKFAIKNTVNFYGLLTLSEGLLEPCDGDTVEVREDRNRYEKLILRDGKPVGVLLQGEIGNSGFWQYLIKNGIDIGGVKQTPWKVSYADFCATDERGEYQWAAVTAK